MRRSRGSHRTLQNRSRRAHERGVPRRDADLVLSAGGRDGICVPRAGGRRGSGPACGVDVYADGNGVFPDGRLYQLVRQHVEVRARTAEITFLAAGAETYEYTFGWRCEEGRAGPRPGQAKVPRP